MEVTAIRDVMYDTEAQFRTRSPQHASRPAGPQSLVVPIIEPQKGTSTM